MSRSPARLAGLALVVAVTARAGTDGPVLDFLAEPARSPAGAGPYAIADAFAPAGNPALLAASPALIRMGAGHSLLFDGREHLSTAAVDWRPWTGSNSTVGIGVSFSTFGADAFDEVDRFGSETGLRITPSGRSGSLAAAASWGPWMAGVGVRAAAAALEGLEAEVPVRRALLADLGGGFRSGSLLVGAALHGLGPDGPSVLEVGFASEVDWNRRGWFGIGWSQPLHGLGAPEGRMGVSWQPLAFLTLHGGLTAHGAVATYAPALGLAVRMAEIECSYAVAYAPWGTGLTHVLGLTWSAAASAP